MVVMMAEMMVVLRVNMIVDRRMVVSAVAVLMVLVFLLPLMIFGRS